MSNDPYQQQNFWNKDIKKKDIIEGYFAIYPPKCETGKKLIKELKNDNKIIRHRERGS